MGSRAARRIRGFAGLLAAGLLLGCASTPRGQREALVGSPHRDFLILPLNTVAVMPDELETLAPWVWAGLEDYLRAQGKELKTVAFPVARRMWLASIQKSRVEEPTGKAGFADAARALVGKLAEHAEFDVLVVPSLYVREAPIAERSAHWDGVERALEFDLQGDGAERLVAETPFEGVAPAASLHVVVFDAEGKQVHEALGGLELLVRVRVRADTTTGAAPTIAFVKRRQLATTPEHLRAGIGEAFAPFLPRLPPTE